MFVQAAAEKHWSAAEVRMISSKLDMQTKMVIFASVNQEYELSVEDLSSAKSKVISAHTALLYFCW